MFRAKVILVLLACATVFVGAGAAAARENSAFFTDRHAPITEVMLLPRFCWGQYLGYRQPQYNIPRRSCGVFMNHYCPGLILLNMSERTFGNPGKKRSLLVRAKRNFEYTLRGMKKYPYCPLRGSAEASLRQADVGLGMFPKAR